MVARGRAPAPWRGGRGRAGRQLWWAAVTSVRDSVPLAELPVGQWGRVCEPLGGDAARRLLVLGFVPGTRIGMIRRAPFGGPVEVELRGYRICLRLRQLAGVRVALEPSDGGGEA